jgi:hypothetical protein
VAVGPFLPRRPPPLARRLLPSPPSLAIGMELRWPPERCRDGAQAAAATPSGEPRASNRGGQQLSSPLGVGRAAGARGQPSSSSAIAGRRGCRETTKETVLVVPRCPGRSGTSGRLAGDQQQHAMGQGLTLERSREKLQRRYITSLIFS